MQLRETVRLCHYVALVFMIAKTTTSSFAQLEERSSDTSSAKPIRANYHIVNECVMVTSEEGQFFHKAREAQESVCGIYLITDPDRYVEVHFDYLDVPCQGGLVSFVDGWEMDRQYFPSPGDHPKPMSDRYNEFCGQRKMKPVFSSSQNAALIQYRIPTKGRGFSVTVKYPKAVNPCNILLEGTADVYTLRNHGKRVNCSLTTIYPAQVKVMGLNVGLANAGRFHPIETGTIHKCSKRGLSDHVEIGGSSGLDTSQLLLADSVCGLDSKPGSTVETVFCGVTTVRLVSSGDFDNSVTVSLRQAVEQDILQASVVCPF